MTDRFGAFSAAVAHWSGKPHVFAAAVAVLILWAIFGPWTGYSEQWQLVVNTGTTILTFLMVFIIQNTQNRHTIALHIKLDEVIRAIDGAKNELIDLEDLSEVELERLQNRFRHLGERARKLKDQAEASGTPKNRARKSRLQVAAGESPTVIRKRTVMMSDEKADKPLADIPLGIPNLGVVIAPPAPGSEGASDNDTEDRDDEVTPKNGDPDSSLPR